MTKSVLDFIDQNTLIQNEELDVNNSNKNTIKHSSLFYQTFDEDKCKEACMLFQDHMLGTYTRDK